MSLLKRAERIAGKFQNPVPTDMGGLGMMLKLLPQLLTNREERKPKTPLGPFSTDASIYSTPPASGLRVTWFGHSSLLIEIDGVRLLTDPVWIERASPVRWAGPKRFFPPTLAVEDVPALDAVILSHDHYDHLGKETVRALAAQPSLAHAVWLAPLGVGAILAEFGVPQAQIRELDWTGMHEVRSARTGAAVQVTAVPARHFSGRSLSNRFETLWASFALRGAKHRVYYGADSGYWDGFAEIAREHGPFDLTMLEAGAWNKQWESIHMGPDGVAKAFHDMGAAGLLMPIHWALFDLALHSWRFPIERMTELADRAGLRLWSPVPGEPTEVAGEELRSKWWVRQ